MLQIAHLSFSSPLVLAPLAGYSDLPFRLLCRRYGAGYCVSEMISCHGLVYGQKKTLQMLRSDSLERPVSFQLFGADPEMMADAAEIMSEFHPDMIDINMGCPVKKVTKNGGGAALMTAPKTAEKILKKVCNRLTLPVTVKIRTGKNSRQINGVDFAKMAEDCGVAAITVHGRTWSQAFAGGINKEIISKIKNNVNIPVLGNGDVLSYRQGINLMEITGCDGVMIGRGALGNPWVFTENGRPNNREEILNTALEHLNLMEKFLPVEKILGYVKNQISKYFKELANSSKMRQKIFAAGDLYELKETMHSFLVIKSII